MTVDLDFTALDPAVFINLCIMKLITPRVCVDDITRRRIDQYILHGLREWYNIDVSAIEVGVLRSRGISIAEHTGRLKAAEQTIGVRAAQFVWMWSSDSKNGSTRGSIHSPYEQNGLRGPTPHATPVIADAYGMRNGPAFTKLMQAHVAPSVVDLTTDRSVDEGAPMDSPGNGSGAFHTLNAFKDFVKYLSTQRRIGS